MRSCPMVACESGLTSARQLMHALGGMKTRLEVSQQAVRGRVPARLPRVCGDVLQFAFGFGELAGADEASRSQIRRDTPPGRGGISGDGLEILAGGIILPGIELGGSDLIGAVGAQLRVGRGLRNAGALGAVGKHHVLRGNPIPRAGSVPDALQCRRGGAEGIVVAIEVDPVIARLGHLAIRIDLTDRLDSRHLITRCQPGVRRDRRCGPIQRSLRWRQHCLPFSVVQAHS